MDQHHPPRPLPLAAWLREGLRSAALQRPDWRGLHASPALLVALLLAETALSLLFERLYIDGPARFYWPALTAGWFSTAVSAFVCWLLVPRGGAWSAAGSAAALFSMLVAQAIPITLVVGTAFVLLQRSGELALITASDSGRWLAWLLPLAWAVAAQLLLVWRSTGAAAAVRLLAGLLLAASMALQHWLQPSRHWYADAAAEASEPAPPPLTQEMLEGQPRLLSDQLRALAPERPGVVDVYAITFAPYADEDVFRRESAMVAGVMVQRFGAEGRSLQLVNHRQTAVELPWATPLNLQRAVRHMARLMNPAEDLLFIHLTSHGAKGGELAVALSPLALEALTPQRLRSLLDEAGVARRIVSISACYSGSWIAPLATPGTLVLTAADAEHTSYGCGRGSELTYYGRAMYDEELRRTWSFEEAHAAARQVIERREREAGKNDGYSNPQISVGDDIRTTLQRLVTERARKEP